MKPTTMLAVAIVAFVLGLSAQACALTETQAQAFAGDLSGALLDMGLARQDCRIRSDYAAPDVFRLPLIDSLMYRPATLLPRLDGLATTVERDSTLAGMARNVCHAMSADPCMELPACAKDLSAPGRRIRDVRGNLAHLPPGLTRSLRAYCGQLANLALLRDAALVAVRRDLDFLYANSPFLVTPRKDYQDYEDIDPFELDRLEREDTALGDSILSLCTRLDRGYLAAMSLSAVRAAEAMGAFIEHFGAKESCECPARRSARYDGRSVDFEGRTSAATGKIIYMGLTDQGPIVVGGWGENSYTGSFALIIDMGGDDSYQLAFDRTVNFCLVIDNGGNDSYASGDRATVAGAICGTSIIMDLGGDDRYRARDISLGAAICGCGALYDRAGNDTYESGAFSQGAGFLGLGLVCDESGNDTYTAGMQSQAFGYVGGAGLIVERGGNDTYLTQMSQMDILRYDDHYLTLSQGCAFGYRPDYAGGIGLLIESAGNDLYSSDIFGQGVGYWFCVGAIVDRAGHDCYRSYQYAQGAGIHLAFGLLSDENGDDYYVSKGVSQGCGHDLSLGLLADFSGNDCYTAVDLSQGAGSANGTGILYDADGVDSYSSKSKVNVSGYGDYRREFGSIGLAIDMKGVDFYSARGENESIWESGRYGLGLDAPGEATKPRGDIAVKDYPFEERPFTTEELYILAMRSEPRFQAWKKYAFDRMVEDSVASMVYLRTVLDTKDATKRHAIKDIVLKIGAPAVPMLSDEVRKGNDLAKAEASWILGLIEHAGGFGPLMELSRSADWKQRSNAVNSLARLKGLDTDDIALVNKRVAEILTDPAEVFYVKKDAAFAAGNQRFYDLAPLLAACLDDAHYSVRFASAEALRQLAMPPPSAQAQTPAAPAAGSTGTPSAPAVGGAIAVRDALVSRIPALTSAGLYAGLYAAGTLPAAVRMDIAEATLRTGHADQEATSVALARLLAGVRPETRDETKRLDELTARTPRDSWKTKTALSHPAD